MTMSMTPEELLEHVRGLPLRERLKLVERVVHDLLEEPGFTDQEQAAMDSELLRRIERAKTGDTVAAEDVIARLRARG